MIPRHVPALALGTLALGVAEFSMMSILLPVADDLGVTVPEAGHFISAYAAGVCAGVLIMAAAARKMPLKTLLLIIVGIITLGNTLTVFVGSYHLMLLSRFIAGLPHGAYFGAAGVLCTQLAEPGKASRDMCLMVAGMTIANLAGVPLASFLAWAVSWRAAFAIAAAAALITFSAIRITVPKVPALPDSGFAAQFRFLRSLEPWLRLCRGCRSSRKIPFLSPPRAMARAWRDWPRQRRILRLLFIRQSRHGTRGRGSGFDDVRCHHARRCRHGAWEPLLRQNFIVLFR